MEDSNVVVNDLRRDFVENEAMMGALRKGTKAKPNIALRPTRNEGL